MPTKQKDFYSSREAARLLGVAVSTIQLWTNNGVLRAWTTNGGHRRIARNSVGDILKQRITATTAPPLCTKEKISIVLVDDDEQTRKLYQKQFLRERINADIIMAQDGYEGLVMIGKILPDIIITDLKMPHIDGFQMIQALKHLPDLKNSLIIVITGLADEEIQIKGGLPQGVHKLTKPIAFQELNILLSEKVNQKTA